MMQECLLFFSNEHRAFKITMQLNDLERDAIVLDEKPISFSSTTRRLKINDHIHVQIQVSQFCLDTLIDGIEILSRRLIPTIQPLFQ